jgi:hypothetical protein
MQQINTMSGKLSPVAAFLADTSFCKGDRALCLQKNYAALFSWNLLWDWGFTSMSIEEAFQTGGGGVCAEQASYIGSILDLMGIKYFALHFTWLNAEGRKKDHRIVYVPQWDVTFSNNELHKGLFLMQQGKGLVYVYRDGQWIYFDDSRFVGNTNYDSAMRILLSLKDIAEKRNFWPNIACHPFYQNGDTGCSDILQNAKYREKYRVIN